MRDRLLQPVPRGRLGHPVAGGLYNVPKFLLVANPIDRYSIGDRTPGLQVAADGSLTICLQHQAPATDQQRNWRPTPEGDFRPIMSMYQPQPEVLAGDYTWPAIRRAR